jgi:hypothetical protein
MASKLKRTFLLPIPYILSDRIGSSITRLLSRNLIKELSGELTDKFIELLLGGMDLSFCLSRGYRKNIKNFKGRYLFQTADGMVEASATFDKANMKVHSEAISDWNVRVTFKDSAALRAYIFSKNQDILDSILKNEVEVDGNLNYIYRFGFLARDLVHRLGLEI